LRDRLHDLDDLANRLMRVLMGQDHAPAKEQMPENAIVVARSMGPAALLDYDRKRLRGLVLEEGGPTSHVSIVARALGIPTVGEIENATGLVESGEDLPRGRGAGQMRVRCDERCRSDGRRGARRRAAAGDREGGHCDEHGDGPHCPKTGMCHGRVILVSVSGVRRPYFRTRRSAIQQP